MYGFDFLLVAYRNLTSRAEPTGYIVAKVTASQKAGNIRYAGEEKRVNPTIQDTKYGININIINIMH
jgi:hypothetical protein